jgi:hypothetical protein
MGYNARNDKIKRHADAARVGSTTRCAGDCAPLQRNASASPIVATEIHSKLEAVEVADLFSLGHATTGGYRTA